MGGPSNGLVTFEDLSARIHPEDLDRVRAAFAATRDILGSYEIDFRILHGDEIRWISARGRGEDQGIVGRVMFGSSSTSVSASWPRKPAKCLRPK